MNVKKFSFLILFSFFFSSVFSQSFMKGVGANISVLFAHIKTEYEEYDFAMEVNHLSFYPRYTISESDNHSVSIGSPLGAGVNIVSDTYGDAGISWGFELPLALDYNIGCQSTPDNENGFGGYFGTGLSYMYTSWKLSSSDPGKVTSFGPVARAGIRFASGGGRWITTVGMYYKKGLEKQKFNAAGFNVLMEL